MIYNQNEINIALQQQAKAFAAFIEPMEATAFETMPGGKWSAGQHLDHLIRSIKPVNLAVTLPGFILKYKFGTNNRKGRTYDELLQRYHEKLAGGGKASGEFVPPSIGYHQKTES
ncbi:MAG: DinB family protein [Sphingobacteriales bacterium JAD_PAG50586_3]|nr:MAG: DinB family protein [Sphingobacteriales bacterium JAD_PAG50586_3]